MDNLTDKLTQIMADPEQFESLKQMAQSMFGGTAVPSPPEPTQKTLEMPTDLSPETINTVMKVVSAMKSSKADDEKTRFLMSLKPLLSKERQNRIDTALKFIRLSALLPLIKDSGLF